MPDSQAKRPIKVGFLATTIPSGPTDPRPAFVLDLARAVAARGCEVDVLTPHVPGALISERQGDVQIERFRYWWPERSQRIYGPGGAIANIRSSPFALLQVPASLVIQLLHARRMARRRRYDLLHAFWLIPSGRIAASAGVPYIVSALGSDALLMRSATAELMKRKALRGASAVAASSHVLARSIQETLPGTNVHVIPFGLVVDRAPDPARVAGIRSRFGRPLVIFVGRITREKGADLLVEALASMPGVKAVICGEGPDRVLVERLTHELELGERISFLGWIPKESVVDWMAAADCVVVPSRSEGQGLTVVEAMAAGTPVVAARLPALTEVVTEEHNGLMFKPESPAALKTAVERIISHPALADRLRQGGRATAAQYTIDRSAEKTLALYKAVLYGGKE